MEKEREGKGEGREVRGRREGEREMRKERRGRREGGGEKMRGIIVALFLIISVCMISCGNAGPVPKEGQAATADGRIIDLAEVSEKIREINLFTVSVKEIEALVKSIINGIAKGIQQKITASGLQSDGGSNAHHTPLLAGAYKVAEIIEKKSKELKVTDSIKDLEDKVKAVLDGSKAFADKLKSENAALGVVSGATPAADAKKAIVIGNSDESKGASDLKALNTAIENLLTAANKLVNDTIKELKTPTKKEATFKP